jgi:uncharacterized lipoprotein YddW (UPF0748 family)
MRRFLLPLLMIGSMIEVANAAPSFGGLAEARPAPGAAVLRWERARPAKSGETVTYRIYRKAPNGWAFARPLEEIRGTEWVVVGLAPGQPAEFIVRARDSSGEDQNTRAMTVTPTGQVPAEEWRAAFTTRFEWPRGTRQEVESRLGTMMHTLSSGNFNAIIFQVRGQGDTFYPSKDEPWSEGASASLRETDPVRFALNEARRNGLQFHAWINLSTIWQSAAKRPPANRAHPFFRFADASKPETRLGLIHDAQGHPVQFGADDYVWLTHGNPEVNAYLRRQVENFIDAYPVDGLLWDDRTGNPNGVSRDPISVQRFSGRGNPMRIADFGEWQRDQLSRFLSDVYVVAKARNPRMLVSASPFGIADRTRIPGYGRFSDAKKFGVEPEKWLSMGVVDALMPQVYWDLPDPEPNYGTVVRDWLSHNRSGRPIWPASALGKYGDVQPINPMQARYVALARSLGTGGNTMYTWGSATPAQWREAATLFYPNKASVPVPNHMRRPIGQVAGYVRQAGGRPVVDAWLRHDRQPQMIHLSSADGFYGIPNLESGNYRLSVEVRPGVQRSFNFSIQPGQTTRLDVTVE